jgi:hypothetical protein
MKRSEQLRQKITELQDMIVAAKKELRKVETLERNQSKWAKIQYEIIESLEAGMNIVARDDVMWWVDDQHLMVARLTSDEMMALRMLERDRNDVLEVQEVRLVL